MNGTQAPSRGFTFSKLTRGETDILIIMDDKYQGRTYRISDSREDWGTIFERESELLKQIFAECDLKFEHIGSTAVPGLAGKPIVDMLAIVFDVSIVEEYLSQLKKSGYKDLGEYVIPGTRLLVREEDGERTMNVHFFPANHPHIEEMLLVRDYLRNNPQEVQKYGDVKHCLAEKFPDDYDSYRREKDEYMKNLMGRARAWRH